MNNQDSFYHRIAPGCAWFQRPTRGLLNSRGILALDPGLRVGWAFVELPEKRVEAAGFFELDRRHLYFNARKGVLELIELLKPSAVMLEQYFVGGKAHNGQSIELRGAMKSAVEGSELPWTEINVSRVRSLMGTKRGMSDCDIREIVADRTGLPRQYQPDPAKKKVLYYPADTWDAVALGWAADSVEGL